MNKMITAALIAGGLLLLDSPEAAAHKEVRNVYRPSIQYRVEHRRAKHMPYWLKRNKSFRRWYKRSHKRRYRHLAWHQLFDIYRWERHYRANHRWGDYSNGHYYRDYDDKRYRGRRNKRGNHRHWH